MVYKEGRVKEKGETEFGIGIGMHDFFVCVENHGNPNN